MSRLLRRLVPAARPVRSPPSPRARLLLRALEDRVVPAAYTVTNVNDAGAGSLRQALVDANANAGADLINFDPAVFGTARAILVRSQLPNVTGDLSVVGPGSGLLTVRRDPTLGVSNVSYLFYPSANAALTVALSGMTLAGGNSAVRTGDEAVTLTDVVLRDSFNNGAVVSAGGSLTIRNSTVTANSNAGINVGSGGSLLLDSSTVSGNAAPVSGGGILVSGTVGPGGVVIRNSTISGNRATIGGGISLLVVTGTVLVQNSTITGNTATGATTLAGYGGGGIAVRSTAVTVLIQSSIVAGNVHTPATGNRPDISATPDAATVTADHSLIGVADTFALSPASAGNRLGTLAAPLDPVLGPLADNGGTTKTHAPLAGSPALNAGANGAGLTTDQRGGPRVNSFAPDMGAVEVVAAGLPVAAAGPVSAVMTAGGTAVQFTVTYTAAAPIAVASVGDGDVLVTGPSGFTTPATLVGVDDPTNGTPRTATYQFAPPGGSWDAADDGTYSLAVRGNEVLDVDGNAVAGGTVALFRVAIPQTFTVSSLADGGPGSLRDAITQSNAAPSVDAIRFAPALFAAGPGVISLATALPAVSDHVTVVGPGSGLLTVRRDSAAAGSFAVLSVAGPAILTVDLSGLTVAGGTNGGLNLSDETVSLTDVVAVNNNAPRGGGIFSTGTLTLTNCTVSGNTATISAAAYGGGIAVASSGSLTMDGCTVSGNVAQGTTALGGGIQFDGGSAAGLTIRNSTISGNVAGSGGGIGVRAAGGRVMIQNSTIVANTAVSTNTAAGSGGGGICLAFLSPTNSPTLQSTIVAGNVQTGSIANRPDVSAGTTAVTADHSLIGVANTFTLSASSSANLTGTLVARRDAKLGPLAADGGPTKTHAPHRDSPALDHGTNAGNLTADQRGAARVQGTAADIGAVERTPGGPDATAGPLVTVTAAGGTSYQFTITYDADTAVDVATLDGGDVRVTGPGGFDQLATFVGVSPAGNGTPRTATYAVTPPGGAWDYADDGEYDVTVAPNQVFDAAGNPVAAMGVGSFRVAVPLVVTVTSLADAGPGTLRQALVDTAAIGSADVIQFAPALFAGGPATINVLTPLPTVVDDLTVTGPGAGLLTVRPAAAYSGAGQPLVALDPYRPRTVTVSGLTVANSTGYGVYAGTGSFTLLDAVVRDNRGGIRVAGGSLVVRGSTISGNTIADSGGGGILLANSSSLLLENSTVSGNSANNGSGGGGIYFVGAVGAGGFTVRNSTIAGNTAGTGAGVALTNLTGTVRIQNSTITANAGMSLSSSVGDGAGGIGLAGSGAAALILQSTIVAGNTSRSQRTDIGTSYPTSAVPITADHSIIGVVTTAFTLSAASTNNLTGTLAAPLDARLRPLATNGGSTQTAAPLPDSPAIDRGSNPALLTTDQRGLARVLGTAADIGAVEHDPVIPDPACGPLPDVTVASTTYQFTVAYYAPAVAVASLDGNDVIVTGPNGFTTAATLVGVNATTNGSPRTATYSFVPPGGSWDSGDYGTYTVTLQDNQVFSTAGVPAPGQVLGTFRDLIGATITVTTLADSGPGSLRDAITRANAVAPTADTIVFAPALFAAGPGTITLLTALPALTDAATITGPGSGLLTVRRDLFATGNFGIFSLAAAGKQPFAISGLTLTGATQTPVLVGDDTATLTDVTVMNNLFAGTSGSGSMGVSGSSGSLTLSHCSIVGNNAGVSSGGGVYYSGGVLEIDDSDVSNNIGGEGGGISLWGGTTFTMVRSTVANNSAVNAGGLFFNTTGFNGLIIDSTITGNTAQSGSLGFDGGGGIAVIAGSLTVQRSTIAGNAGLIGGGVMAFAGTTLQVLDSTVSGNTATGFGRGGGGVYFGTAAYVGSGWPHGGGSVTVRNSTISGNTAETGGGLEIGTPVTSGSVTLQNCTVTGNVATSDGSVIGYGGGGISLRSHASAVTLTLQSTIVAGNENPYGRPDIAVTGGPAVTADHSLIGVVDDVPLSAASTANRTGTFAAPLDAKLAPLADNGGPTKTHALLAGSPALNAGSNPANLTADQRGSGRVVGPVADVGAYEYAPLKVVGVQVNDGAAQRSQVRSITVTFSGPVAFAGGNANAASAFALTRIGGGAVELSAAVAADGRSVTLTFTGTAEVDPASAQNGGPASLADGRYHLAIADGAVTDAALGWAVDGDADNAPGGGYNSADDTAGTGAGHHLGLYRLFGDVTGDGAVDPADLAGLTATFNETAGSPAYRAYLDADADGAIDLVDLARFRTRFNVGLF